MAQIKMLQTLPSVKELVKGYYNVRPAEKHI